MKNKLLLLLAVCGMVLSCTKDDGGKAGNKKTYAEISNLDIVGESHIFTTGSGNTQRGRTRSDDQTKDHLFKVLTDGQTVEVIIKDKDGNVLPVEQMMVKPATDDLIFFAYSFNNAWLVDPSDNYWEAETVGGAYFARKSDGAVFEIPKMFYTAFGWTGNGGYEGIFKDKNQNLYCRVDDGVYKMESKNGITATRIASGIPRPLDNPYKIDWYGNVLYFNDFGNVRCVTPSGKNFILDLSEISQTIEGEWEGGMGPGDMGQHFTLMGMTPLIGNPDGGGFVEGNQI